jgi:hypothetical protein
MTHLMFLDAGRCSDLLNSTSFFKPTRRGPSCLLMLSCCGLSCKTALNSELWTRSKPSWRLGSTTRLPFYWTLYRFQPMNRCRDAQLPAPACARTGLAAPRRPSLVVQKVYRVAVSVPNDLANRWSIESKFLTL